jgi:hypothetical protein
MSRPVGARLPWEPLGRVVATVEINRAPVLDHPNLIGRALGISGSQVSKLRRSGLTVAMADRLCRQIERHPAEIWDSWNDVAAEEAVTAS